MQQLEIELEEDEETAALYSNGATSNGLPKRESTSRCGSLCRILLVASFMLGLMAWWSQQQTTVSNDMESNNSSNSDISDTPAQDTNPPPPPDDGDTTTDPPTASPPKSMLYSKLSQIVPDPEHTLPIPDETRDRIAEKWGKWHFYDGDETNRPVGDYCAEYPYRDIPGDDLPNEAWQGDAVYVNHILDDAEQLIDRTMEAIYTEYGWGKPQPPKALADRLKLFDWMKLELDEEGIKEPAKYNKRGDHGGGGWTTERSFDGLVRRLLHAMHTNDSFTVVLGGHSAAAGHGNHFRQSYMMQFHKIMAPVLARMGVKLKTRNMSQGGLGTLQNALGMRDLYGDEIDLILWDSGMTENDKSHVDLFLRQALLSGNRVPVIWGGLFDQLKSLHKEVEADVGFFGNGMDGIRETTSEEQAKELPYAVRYLKCPSNRLDLCKTNRFCAKCWIDRDDIGRDKFQRIDEKVPSQVKWHPGWRHHQLVGRVLALSMLEVMQVAVQQWSDGTMGGPPLDDSLWHVKDYYQNIRDKLKSYVGACEQIAPQLPARVCNTALHGRSLFTPRANPRRTSLLTLLKPAPDGYKPHNRFKMLYDGPDVHNKCYDVKPGEVDAWLVASNRRNLATVETKSSLVFDDNHSDSDLDTFSVDERISTDGRRLDAIVPGRGWQHHDEYPGNCDGSYDAICGRHYPNNCPLLGHHDSRGFLSGNELSGWLVMEIPQVKEGLIIMKVLTWLDEGVNTRTQNWNQVNNGKRVLRRYQNTSQTSYNQSIPFGFDDDQSEERILSDAGVDDWPDGALFDFAINGKVTTLNKDALKKKVYKIQRVLETITLLDDPNFGTKEKVELAVRLRNCGRKCTLGVTHLYWA